MKQRIERALDRLLTPKSLAEQAAAAEARKDKAKVDLALLTRIDAANREYREAAKAISAYKRQRIMLLVLAYGGTLFFLMLIIGSCHN